MIDKYEKLKAERQEQSSSQEEDDSFKIFEVTDEDAEKFLQQPKSEEKFDIKVSTPEVNISKRYLSKVLKRVPNLSDIAKIESQQKQRDTKIEKPLNNMVKLRINR